MLNQYTYEITWSEDDAQFIGLCKEFPYLSAFGDTQEEALKEIKEVVEFSLEWMKEDGEELPNPIGIKQYGGKILLRIPVSLHSKVACQANINEVSINQFLLNLISENLFHSKIEKSIECLNNIIGTCETVSDEMFFQLRRNSKNILDQQTSIQMDIKEYTAEKLPRNLELETVV